MIEKDIKVYQADAGDAGYDPPDIDLTEWEGARVQLEAGSVSISGGGEYSIYLSVSKTDPRTPPDVTAGVLNNSTRMSPNLDVASLAYMRVKLTTAAGSSAPVQIHVLRYRTLVR